MNELLGLVSQLVDYLEENAANLNQATQRELAVFLQEVMEFITEYQGSHPIETLQPEQLQQQIQPGMPSSNVEGFAYDDDSQRLLVRFLGPFPQRNGPIYAYEGVPKVIFELFQAGAIPARTDGQNKWGKWWRGKVPSLGASLYTLIKNRGYPYQRLIG